MKMLIIDIDCISPAARRRRRRGIYRHGGEVMLYSRLTRHHDGGPAYIDSEYGRCERLRARAHFRFIGFREVRDDMNDFGQARRAL